MPPPSGRILVTWLAFLLLSLLVTAEQTQLTSDDYYTTTCSGIWSKDSIPGGIDPFIKVTFDPSSQGKTALLIYEWQDFEQIGAFNNQTYKIQYICDKEALSAKLCETSQYGEFIVHPDENNKNNSLFTDALDLKAGNEPTISLYKVEQTGYYCVAIMPANLENDTTASFAANIEWRHPYGELPASDYPKLLFYGIFALLYLAVGLFWGIQSWRYWDDILPVQHFLSGTIFFLTVEMAINWGFWEAYNQTGSPSYGLLALVALLNAGRNSMSFFMLLVVCMGYSVVKPSLGSTMKKCVILASVHFAFGVVYSLGVTLLSPETAGFLVLLVVFPLAMTMSAFYVWTFSSLALTMSYLETRHQHEKVRMYKRLQRLLLFSVIMVIVIFVLNMFAFSDRNEMDWAAHSWKWRWVMLDGLLNLLYFIVFLGIIILWRPTNNNQRYGLMQISQDEDEAIDLENRLRRAEGLGQGEHNLGDETAIFEVGDDDLSDDERDKVKLVSAAGQRNEVSQTSGSYAPVGGSHSQSSPPPRYEERPQPHQRGQQHQHQQHEDDEEEDDIDDDEHAALTRNARK